MKIISPNKNSLCLPMRIVPPTDSINNGKLGGRPPKGIIPKRGLYSLKYFITVKLSGEENLFISLFVADFENLLGVRGRVNKLGMVENVIHKPQQRENNSQFQSQISEHDIQILETENDSEEIDKEIIYLSGHKIGGFPHLIRNKNNLENDINKLFENGFLQIVQIDFPGNQDDVVSGDWPFGDGIFSLFGKAPFENENWFWCWDM